MITGTRAVRAAFVVYVALVVGAPLTAIAVTGVSSGGSAMWQAVSAPEARDALVLTLWTALIITAVNGVMGTITAWVLVRYRFPARGLLSSVVDLPFAVPTLVTGVILVMLFGPDQVLGAWLSRHGIEVLYHPPAIVLVLLFITAPFVVRAVEPVLAEADAAEEEAAHTMGASDWLTFRRVILPAILPAILYGMLQCFARALAEFGSIVVVSGNIPHRTLTAAVHVFGQVESGRTQDAATLSLLLLTLSIGLSLTARALRTRPAT